MKKKPAKAAKTEIPGLGVATPDKMFADWLRSEPLPVSVLGGKLCRFIVQGYENDPNKEEFHAAITNFLSLKPATLHACSPHVFNYYKNCNSNWEPDDKEFITITSAKDVWEHVRLGDEPMITRRAYGDKGIYVYLNCNCDWEEEHGLQIVFKNGLLVNKIGQDDGHLTNSDAFANEKLEHVIYVEF